MSPAQLNAPTSYLLHILGELKPLQVAAYLGDEHILSLLIAKLSAGDIEASDSAGDRPLHYAAMSDASSSVQTLLEHGAEINSRNHAGRTLFIQKKVGHIKKART